MLILSITCNLQVHSEFFSNVICLLFRSYIPYFCPRVCDGSHLHKIIIDLDQILDKIHPITLKSVINYTQLQLLFSNYPIPENHII